MIELRNVEKTVKNPAGTVWLLRRINVKVNEGEFVTVMGPSGAGKTTLLSIVGMLDDGWAGARDWTQKLRTAVDLTDQHGLGEVVVEARVEGLPAIALLSPSGHRDRDHGTKRGQRLLDLVLELFNHAVAERRATLQSDPTDQAKSPGPSLASRR